MPSLDRLNYIQPYIRWVKIDRNVSLSGHWIDYDNVFTFVASGEATFVLGGESYQVREGDVVLIPPRMRHLITSDSKGPFSEYIFHYDLFLHNAHTSPVARHRIPQGAEREITEDEMLLAEYPMVIRLPEEVAGEIRRLYLKMHREFHEKRPCAQGLMQAYAKNILLLAYRCTVSEARVVKEDNNLYSWNSIQRIVEIIQTKYHYPRLSIKEIADIVGFSPNYISTLFKENLGVTIHEYLTFVRIEVAKQLLYESSRNITQIAEEVGYSSIYAFSRSFKQAAGMSPSQYAHRVSVRMRSGDVPHASPEV